jgi:hypothetical protein
MNTIGFGYKMAINLDEGFIELKENYQFFYTNQRGLHWKLFGKSIFRTLLKITGNNY